MRFIGCLFPAYDKGTVSKNPLPMISVVAGCIHQHHSEHCKECGTGFWNHCRSVTGSCDALLATTMVRAPRTASATCSGVVCR